MLSCRSENTVPTKNDQIMVAQVKQYNFDEVSAKIEKLISLAKKVQNASDADI